MAPLRIVGLVLIANSSFVNDRHLFSRLHQASGSPIPSGRTWKFTPSIDPQQLQPEAASGEISGKTTIHLSRAGNIDILPGLLGSGRRLHAMVIASNSLQDMHGILQAHEGELTAAHARAMLLRLRRMAASMDMEAAPLPPHTKDPRLGLETRLRALIRMRQRLGDPHPFKPSTPLTKRAPLVARDRRDGDQPRRAPADIVRMIHRMAKVRF